MKKLVAGLALLTGTAILAPMPAHAGGSTDAALALGAFAVFNQIVRGETVFNAPRPAVVYAPPPVVYAPPPAVYYAPPPPVVYAPPPAVYYAPPPVVYAPAPPVFYAPAPVVVYRTPVFVQPGYGRYVRRHHWHRD